MNLMQIPIVNLKTDEKIPRLIHYCWFGGKPLPPLAQKCIQSWKKYLPDYKIVCWDESAFDVNSHPYTKEAYTEKKWAFVTDYVRLKVLYKYGGLYMDTDIEIVKSLDHFMKNPAFSCFEPPNYLFPEIIVIQTGLIGAEKENIWIKKMLDYYNEKKFLNEFGLPEMEPNPIPLTRITVREFGLELNHKYQELLNSVVIYPKEYFCPINWRDRAIEQTVNTYAIHHFAGSWIDEKKYTIFDLTIKKISYIIKMIFGAKIYNFLAEHSWRKQKKYK